MSQRSEIATMESRTGQTVVAAALALVLAGSATPGLGQEGEGDGDAEEGRVVLFGVELIGEVDDNPNLGADTGELVERPKSDFVVRVRPSFQADYPYRDHRFKLDLGGIIREGGDSQLSEANGRGRASAQLVFANGLELEIYDFYLRTRFDQALFFVEDPDLDFAEPGISETEGNTVGASFSYTPKRRFTVEGSFSATDEHFVFGSPDTPEDDREKEVFAATVEFPLRLEWVGYLALDGDDHASTQQAPRNFDERRYAAGLRWERSERLALFAEAGTGQADFADQPGTEFDHTVWAAGAEVDFSDDSRLELSFGSDLYGKPIYEVLLDRTRGTDSGLRVLLRRSTQNSFAAATLGRIFEATIFGLRWKQFFGEKVELTSELRYFNLVAGEGELNQDDTTALGRVALEYALVSDWLRIGGFAQLSSRDSNTPASEFDNTRIGVSLKLVRRSF